MVSKHEVKVDLDPIQYLNQEGETGGGGRRRHVSRQTIEHYEESVMAASGSHPVELNRLQTLVDLTPPMMDALVMITGLGVFHRYIHHYTFTHISGFLIGSQLRTLSRLFEKPAITGYMPKTEMCARPNTNEGLFSTSQLHGTTM